MINTAAAQTETLNLLPRKGSLMSNLIHSVKINPSGMPKNLRTVAEFRKFADAIGKPSWKSAMRYYANLRGGAYVMRADGSLEVLSKLANGKLRQTTYKPGKWAFDTTNS